MKRLWIISIGLHGVLLSGLFLLGPSDFSNHASSAVTVRLASVRMSAVRPADPESYPPSSRPAGPSEKTPDAPVRSAGIPVPAAVDANITDISLETPAISELISKTEEAPVHPAALPESVLPEFGAGVFEAFSDTPFEDENDPLAGMDDYLAENTDIVESTEKSWNLSWLNGSRRGILESPEFDPPIPTAGDKIQDVRVSILVSPRGEVRSAEVVSPGSGDVHLDRYMHSFALKFVFKSRPKEAGDQEGSLRLRIREASP